MPTKCPRTQEFHVRDGKRDGFPTPGEHFLTFGIRLPLAGVARAWRGWAPGPRGSALFLLGCAQHLMSLKK